MKRLFVFLTIALLGAGLVACESLKLGDAGLSKAPETSGATIDTLFASLKDADKVLANAYYYLPYGLVSSFDSKMGGDFLESITDHFISNTFVFRTPNTIKNKIAMLSKKSTLVSFVIACINFFISSGYASRDT